MVCPSIKCHWMERTGPNDHVSYRLAKIRGVNPIEVKPIVSLKKEIKNNIKINGSEYIPNL